MGAKVGRLIATMLGVVNGARHRHGSKRYFTGATCRQGQPAESSRTPPNNRMARGLKPHCRRNRQHRHANPLVETTVARKDIVWRKIDYTRAPTANRQYALTRSRVWGAKSLRSILRRWLLPHQPTPQGTKFAAATWNLRHEIKEVGGNIPPTAAVCNL